MSADGSVTVLVGDVSGGDDGAVWGHVRVASLDHGDRALRAGLQVTDFFYLDSVVGLESATIKATRE